MGTETGPMNEQPTLRQILIATVGYALCAWVVLITVAWAVWQMLEAG
jgi:hypothetical protein